MRKSTHPVLRALRILGGVILVLLLTLLATIAGFLVYVHTSSGRGRVRAMVVAQVRQRVPGFDLGSIGGNLPREIVLRDIRIDDAARRPALRVAEVRTVVALLPLLRKTIRVDRLTVVEPRVLVRENPDGQLNVTALVRQQAGPKEQQPLAWNVELGSVELIGGVVDYRVKGEGAELRGLTIDAAAHLRGEALGGRLRVRTAARARGRDVKLELAAVAEVTRQRVDATLHRLAVVGATPRGVVSLAGGAHGPRDRIDVELTAVMPGDAAARVAGRVGFTTRPTYDVALSVARLNPRELVATLPAGSLNARATAAGAGTPLQPGARARLDLELLPSDVERVRRITARVRAALDGRAWRLAEATARVPGAELRATGHGRDRSFTVDLGADVGVRRGRVTALPVAVAGTARLRAHAAGTLPDRIVVRAEGHGRDLRAGGASLERIDLDLAAAGPPRLPQGRLHLDLANLRLARAGQRVEHATVDLTNEGGLRLTAIARGPALAAAVDLGGQVAPDRAAILVRALSVKYGDTAVALA
ncbi:MAG TPA: AsmA family protein, partial [Polyangia bacterium]